MKKSLEGIAECLQDPWNSAMCSEDKHDQKAALDSIVFIVYIQT